ncbi:putative WD repeat-containing protein 65 [Monocercomonoides exilis]|uniref:putative WD repeat-containing protein 65 n=1 Tax=Monocercomonoides exilis TaxID=2049356 RepID=UPI00355A2254|nr:putative WD repeat-containing protein 65 [Monocercomonoides exilis]|eukprot:MONOS_3018.1-p1 / transcript=MONOS_3018.1 / gene=MONOS_3018 / organism=Monocercomonoides_exilis_PA203 / gene_product=WD repeat-containing protein 65 isoform a / transcript_product=WD repeat-containing protein 65 isoform a / location=Mono_scaffold00067:27451-32686(+) / protein_length=1723 / sequence_SO=supercontig / SO=protein_coding / is_pseudo=false
MNMAISTFHHKATITPIHAFGITKGLPSNVFHLDNDRIVYPVGKHFGIYSFSTKTMTFIHETEKEKIITQTAINVSPDKKYMAVCEVLEDDIPSQTLISVQPTSPTSTSNQPVTQVSIYSFTTMKRLRALIKPADVADSPFQCVAFSGDGKHLAVGCGGSDHSLILWHWNQPLRVLGVAKQQSAVTQISFHPLNSSQMCISGPKLLKVVKWTEGVLKQYNLLSGRHNLPSITAHLWMANAVKKIRSTNEGDEGNKNDADEEEKESSFSQSGGLHERVSDRILAAAEGGDVYIFDKGELKMTMPSILGEGVTVTTLMARNDGGFVAASDNGCIGVFAADPEGLDAYRLVQLLQLPPISCSHKDGREVVLSPSSYTFSPVSPSSSPSASVLASASSSSSFTSFTSSSSSSSSSSPSSSVSKDLRITAASLSPNESQVVCVCGGSQICSVRFPSNNPPTTPNDSSQSSQSNQQPNSSNSSNSASSASKDSNLTSSPSETDINQTARMPSIEYLGHGFHSGAITSLSAAVRKPIAATCGTDGWVRIWNYLEMDCVLAVQMEGELMSLSLHPSGFHLILSCGDRVRLMNVMPQTLDTIREIPFPQHSGCQEVLFGHGGHVFACAHGKTVSVYNTYSGECLCIIKGHTATVRTMAFGPTDKTLATAGADGAVYDWTLETRPGESVRRLSEHVLSGTVYSHIAVGNKKEIAVCGSDLQMREIVDGTATVEFPTGGVTSRVNRLLLLPGGLALVAGMAKGMLRIYAWPLTETFARDTTKPDSAIVPVCDEYIAHAASVTSACASGDGSVMLTAGDDGVLFVWLVQPIDFGRVRPAKLPEPASFWDANIISKAALEEQHQKMITLQNKIKELSFHTESLLLRTEKQNNSRLAAEKRKHEEILGSKQALIKTLEMQAHESKVKYEQKVSELEEQHLQATDELEEVYEKDVEAKQQMIVRLKEEKTELQKKFDQTVQQMQEQFSWKEDRIKKHYEQIDQQNQKAFDALKEEMKALADKYETALRQQTEESMEEITQVKGTHEEELNRERVRRRDMDENILYLQTQLRQAIDAVPPLQSERMEMQKKYADAKATVEQLRAELRAQDVRMSEHEESITDKETLILRLKKQNQELDKFKFVLDYKIRELEKTIEPKNEQIAALEEQIEEMDAELEKEHRHGAAMDAELVEKQRRMDVLKDENRQLKTKTTKQARLIERFSHDLTQLVQQEPRVWIEEFPTLSQTFLAGEGPHDTTPQMDSEKLKEFGRQREYLEQSVKVLKEDLNRHKSKGRRDVLEKLDENIQLIEEINELRKEKRALLDTITDIKKDIIGLRSQMVVKAAQSRMKEMHGLPAASASTSSAGAMGSESLPESTKRKTKGRKNEAGNEFDTIFDGKSRRAKDLSKNEADFESERVAGDGVRAGGKPKGKLYRGSTRETQEILEGKTRAAELLVLLDANTAEMKRQQEELNMLRTFMEDLVAKADAEPGQDEELAHIAEAARAVLRPLNRTRLPELGGNKPRRATLSSMMLSSAQTESPAAVKRISHSPLGMMATSSLLGRTSPAPFSPRISRHNSQQRSSLRSQSSAAALPNSSARHSASSSAKPSSPSVLPVYSTTNSLADVSVLQSIDPLPPPSTKPKTPARLPMLPSSRPSSRSSLKSSSLIRGDTPQMANESNLSSRVSSPPSIQQDPLSSPMRSTAFESTEERIDDLSIPSSSSPANLSENFMSPQLPSSPV